MSEKNRIPKIIHYVWFGRGKKNSQIEKCIESWRKYLPEYKIIEWNEDNFDLNLYEFTKGAYKEKNMPMYRMLLDFMFCIIMEEYIWIRT